MSLNKRTIRSKYKSFDEFIENEQGKHFCGCGCNEVIELKQSHFWNGIPKYIFGHAARLYRGVKPYDHEKYYSVEDIAKIAGVSDQTVRFWNRSGHILPEIKVGRKNLFLREQIDRFLKDYPRRTPFDPLSYYSVQDLKKIGVSRAKLRTLVRAGKIQEPRHYSRKTYYLKTEIDSFYNEIIEDESEKIVRPRVPVWSINKLAMRLEDLEERVKLLEDSLLRG